MPMKQAIYTLEMGVIKRSASVILKRTSVTSTRKVQVPPPPAECNFGTYECDF
jgi:hypothetical protein